MRCVLKNRDNYYYSGMTRDRYDKEAPGLTAQKDEAELFTITIADGVCTVGPYPCRLVTGPSCK